MTSERSTRPAGGGRFDVLLDAAERVWATAPPSEVTMRRIAEEAGFSLGLAYHYVADRDGLFGAVLERIGERLAARARSHADPREGLLALWAAMEANPAFAPLMTSLVLEGRNVSELMARHPVVADLAADAAEHGAADPELVGAMEAFVGISVQTFEVLMNRTMGRSDDDGRFREAVADMFSAWAANQVDDRGSGDARPRG